MRIILALVLMIAAANAYWADVEPALKCCEIDIDCLEQYASHSGQVVIGPNLNSNDRRLCTRNSGRGTWCVAQWENANWYCISPRTFLSSTRWFNFCKGGKYPNSKSTEGCKKKVCKNNSGDKQLSSSCEKEVKKQICI
uniref:Uncharacterized protein n=1 Tax=Rhodosorus marinus TaxID=101924 RepID=A0A7S2ZNX2_9RHOD|mmetsp:Transcript_25641/g.101155  ORF Transcript_25641/g.101155 Transcript_25641/m.101155 type:complete len:139 (+) Transcript_25641:953-1369(+)